MHQNHDRIEATSDQAHTLDGNYGKGLDNHGQRTAVMIREATKKGFAIAEEGDSINTMHPDSKTRRGRVGKQIAATVDTSMHQATLQGVHIRRLTPTECERLQGFPDDWTTGSDHQRYKQCGNAVTVNVVEAVMAKLKGCFDGE